VGWAASGGGILDHAEATTGEEQDVGVAIALQVGDLDLLRRNAIGAEAGARDHLVRLVDATCSVAIGDDTPPGVQDVSRAHWLFRLQR
jgi:hypothetical protein